MPLNYWRYNISATLLSLAWGTSLFMQRTDSVLYGVIFTSILCSLLISPLSFDKNKYQNPLCFLFGCFLLITLINALTTQVPFITYMFIYIVLAAPVIFLLLVGGRHPDYFLGSLVWILAPMLVALALWANWQFVASPNLRRTGVFYPLLNPNNLSAIFNIGMIMSVGFLAVQKDKSMKALLIICTIIFLSGLIVTRSYAGYACGFLSLAPFLLFIKKPKRIKAILLITLTTACLLITITYNYNYVTEVKSFNTRISLWLSSWEMFKLYFVQGSGLGTFSSLYPQYRLPSDIYSAGYFAHNDMLQFAIEMGVLAPICLYAIACFMAIKTYKFFRSTQAPCEKIKALTCLSTLGCVFAHAHVSFHLYMPPITILMGFIFYYWYVTIYRSDLAYKPLNASGRSPIMSRIILVSTILACMVWPVRVSMAHYKYNNIQKVFLTDPQNVKLRDNLVTNYKDRAPKSDWRVYLVAAKNMHYAMDLNTKNDDSLMSVYMQGLQYIETGKLYHPYNHNFDYMEAKLNMGVYYINNDPDYRDRAILALQEALKKNPYYLEAYKMLANLYVNDGQKLKALSVLAKGLNKLGTQNFSDLSYLKLIADLKKDTNRHNGLPGIERRIKRLEHALKRVKISN